MDPTRWPFAPVLPRPSAARPYGPSSGWLRHGRVKLVAGLLGVVTLLFGSACVKKDWIDRTLVTVDVTGTWSGRIAGTGFQPEVFFDELRQEGSKVTGFMRITPSVGREGEGPIDGTVSGDVFRFRQTNGGVEGELTVSEDEMNGRASLFGSGRSLSLRRTDRPSPPASPPR
jgi:hypothetical protein